METKEATTSITLPRGTKVSHRIYGNGTVLDEWGSWFSCRSCYIELPPNQIQCAECQSKHPDAFDDLHATPLQVSGKGTYDVLFHKDHKIHSINIHWLVVRHGLIAA